MSKKIIFEDDGNFLSVRSTLKIKNFRFLLLAQVISYFGSSLTDLALLIYVNNVTHSTLALAAMAMMLAIPQVIFGLFSGTFIDQLDRKRIMILSDIFRGVFVLCFIVGSSTNQIWLLFVFGFLHASAGTFFNPARSAIMPEIVEKKGLVAANSLTQTSYILFTTLGTTVAGVLIATLNAFWLAFTLDALTFFASALLVSFINTTFNRNTINTNSRVKQIREAVSIVLNTRDLLGTLIAGLIVLLGLGSLDILYVPLLINDLKVSESWFGVVQLSLAVAMVISGITITTLRRSLKPTQMISYGLVGLGLAIGFLYFSTNIWQVIIIRFVVGLFAAPVNATTSTIVQSTVSNQLRGRVSAFYASINSSAIVISQGFTGVFASLIGVRAVFIVICVLSIIGGLLSGFIYRGFNFFWQGSTIPKRKI